ncbi:MAG: phosphatidate cytidylyltransferase [Microbacteriaceae bacterium]
MSDDFRAQMNAARADIERQFEDARAQFDATQERINARTGRNLLGAILIGLVGGGILLVSLLVFKELFVLFGLVVIGFASFELSTALRAGTYRVPRWVAAISAAAVLPLTWFAGVSGLLWGVLGAIALTVLVRLLEQLGSQRTNGPQLWRDVSASVFVHGYVTALGACAVLLTVQPNGQWWTLSFIILAILSDTGAYAAGLMWGKHKMAPVISPKKTWEGFAGGGFAAALGGVLLGWLLLGIGPVDGLVLGLLIFLTATLGDLAESLIKRDLGIKDMSSWLPGHGGFLDRLDSILPSAAVAYACYVLMLAH